MRLTYYSFIELCMVIALEKVTYMFNSLDRLRNICMELYSRSNSTDVLLELLFVESENICPLCGLRLC